MVRRFFLAVVFLHFPLLAVSARADAKLTALEMRWLKAGTPVLNFAKSLKLPVDIIVQPESKPTDVPLAMGFVDGRCKLVLSMRGNANVEGILATLPLTQRPAAIEAMMAHEMGHCWRYLHGVWHQLPAGMVEAAPGRGERRELSLEQKQMAETRREEGFADLVGLAWTLEHHPEQYEQVYRWFEQLRQDQSTSGGYHDTRAWIRLARNPKDFRGGESPFERIMPMWKQGLLGSEN